MTIDWTDETLRSLDELARIAFPEGSGVTAKTLKLRARQGKLAVYRPGKAYLSTLVGIRAMVEETRMPVPGERVPMAVETDALGLTPMQRSSMALDQALGLGEHERKKAERKQLREKERALNAPAHKLEMKERRKKRARERYREKARLKAHQK
jgi:hypothetical protein